jgi:hypothetical protein
MAGDGWGWVGSSWLGSRIVCGVYLVIAEMPSRCLQERLLAFSWYLVLNITASVIPSIVASLSYENIVT